MDTFERNLENAQLELQMDAAHYVPVLYRSQMELSNVMSALPTLLLLGFLIWSFRRTGRMMGGGGGRGGGRGPFGGGGQGGHPLCLHLDGRNLEHYSHSLPSRSFWDVVIKRNANRPERHRGLIFGCCWLRGGKDRNHGVCKLFEESSAIHRSWC